MSQTSVDEQRGLHVGQKADSGFDDVLSRTAEGAIPFGRLVSTGTDKDRQVKLPALAVDITDVESRWGVALRTQAIESNDAVTPPQYADKAMVSVLHKGRVAVIVEDAVDTSSDVFVNFQNGDEGAFRSDAGGGDAAQLAGARWHRGAGVGEIAVLELDL